MSRIEIKAEGLKTSLTVDGAALSTVATGVTVSIRPGHRPVVMAELAAQDTDVDLTHAELRIADLAMSPAIEQAVLDYLCKKYPATSMLRRAESSGEGLVGLIRELDGKLQVGGAPASRTCEEPTPSRVAVVGGYQPQAHAGGVPCPPPAEL